MQSRIIIFGDIHGCYEEWDLLMDKLNVTDQDQLIAVGDLVAKGPSTKKVLDRAMSLPNLTCLMGNHELYLLEHWKRNSLHTLNRGDHQAVVKELGDDIDRYLQFIASWPYYLELETCLVVHAGIDPQKSLQEQKRETLVSVRQLANGKPWYESYTASKLIVHGHWAQQGVVMRDNVIGLDSGCVYGRELTALVLPERECVSVKAKRVYQKISS